MRLLIACNQDPFGPSHGGTLRTRSFVEALSTEHEVDVVVAARTAPPSGVGANEVSLLRRAKRSMIPMPTRMGVDRELLSAKIAEYEPDLVLASALNIATCIRRIVEPDRLIVDYMDLWSLFCRREARRRGGVSRLTARAQAQLIAKEERRVALGAHAVACAGWSDNEQIRKSGVAATWIPTSVAVTGPSRRPGNGKVGFIGNFHYEPNLDALHDVVKLGPEPFRRAGIGLVIAGRGAQELDGLPDWIENRGEVGDVSEFYAGVDATLSPIRAGGGMKVKVAESWAYGRPVIATAESLEGFPPDLHDSAYVIPAGTGFLVPGRDVIDAMQVPQEVATRFDPSTIDRQIRDLARGAT